MHIEPESLVSRLLSYRAYMTHQAPDWLKKLIDDVIKCAEERDELALEVAKLKLTMLRREAARD